MFEQHPDAIKWNARYQKQTEAKQELPKPCSLLSQQLHLLPTKPDPAKSSLDLAAGLGGNAIQMAQLGWDSHAWDISKVGLASIEKVAESQGLEVTTKLVDIEQQKLPTNSFDLIIVSYFLSRELCPAIEAALKPNGLLYYQTFAWDKISSAGPSSEPFLLKNNELLTLFPNLTVRFYQHYGSLGDLDIGDRNTIQMVAHKATYD
ncbi:MAG: methyltransferase domain-containing protein [Pseudomonadales bacterium]|nr:methyltransferase domain-containing protein [Pseudomonadales bacterium]